MAIAKSAHVVDAKWVSPDTRIVTLLTDEPFGHIGGQYVLVDSGRVLPSGKAAKRAYSILSADTDQHHLELAVMRIPEGPCSGFMHVVDLGTEIRLSGPWGKLYPPEAPTGRAVVLATDTGISAALGLVRSVRFAPLLPHTTLVWLRTSPDYFLPESYVREAIPRACRSVHIGPLPKIGDAMRIAVARDVFASILAMAPVAHGFIAGDGAVNYALLPDLVAAGVAATKDNVESFFNMPKKAAS